MTKVILKPQKEKKSEKEQEQKKQKQKQESFTLTKSVIRNKLLNHFSNHIGKENKTSVQEIFQVVVGINPHQVDSFMRFYWWNFIERIIRELRKLDRCFIIKQQGNYYVLKEQGEADYYKKVCDKAIKGMENAQTRADEWVENEKWRDVENYEDDSDDEDKEIEEEEVEQPKTTTERINENINQAKNRIIKVWKGEK